MLVIGTHTNDPRKLVSLVPKQLLYHTLVVGQSGSGKSFFLARLVEELLARTRARVIIVDPNGDFRSFWQLNPDVWKDGSLFRARLAALDGLCATEQGIVQLDNEADFKEIWEKKRFVYLVAGETPTDLPDPGAKGRFLQQPLLLDWSDLGEERDFLLRADAVAHPHLALGLQACKQRVTADYHKSGVELQALIDVATKFSNKEIPVEGHVKALSEDDWSTVIAVCRDLANRYSLWSPTAVPGEPSPSKPPSLCDYVDAAFPKSPPEGDGTETFEDDGTVSTWDALTVSLDATKTPQDALLAVDVVLSRLWDKAKEALRDRTTSEKVDTRVPTFIVVDEAHNFAPREAQDELQERVTAWLLRVASEGRKYGLYLILATQRPTKLHRGLVPECENSCVLRVQSTLEQDFASDALGIMAHRTKMTDSFVQGQGLLHGRWTDGSTLDAKAAPARTRVGGGGLPGEWATPLEPEAPPPPGGGAVDQDAAIAAPTSDTPDPEDKVRDIILTHLKASDQAIRLVELVNSVKGKAPDAGPGGGWLGRGTFKELVSGLDIPDLKLDRTPPGYAYLVGRHEPPSQSVDAEIAPAYSKLLADARLPKLTPAEYGAVFRVLAQLLNNVDTFTVPATTKEARDELHKQGYYVARSAIDFILKGIMLARHRIGDGRPQDAATLANTFAQSVMYRASADGIALDEDAAAALRELITGSTDTDAQAPAQG